MRKITTSIVAVGLITVTGCADSGNVSGNISKDQQDSSTRVENPIARTENISDNNAQEAAVASDKTNDVMSAEMPGYKDGAYTADGSYLADDGDVSEDIDFRIEIKDQKVVSLELIGEPSHPISEHHQADFMDIMPSQIVGKNIADLQVETVSGASDTTTGFRKALTDIQKQAQQS